MFVHASADAMMIGPVVIPGVPVCLRCTFGAAAAEHADEHLARVPFRGPDDPVFADAQRAVATAFVLEHVRSLLEPGSLSDLVGAGVRIGPNLSPEQVDFMAVLSCPSCGGRPTESDTASSEQLASGLAALHIDAQAALEHERASGSARENGGLSRHTDFRTVGILGGGTAGYLTALTLRALRPELDVTLIESSRIPVIGVGEATTLEIVPYLHSILKLDIADFYRKVRPTFKLGIRFEWGLGGQYHFNYPFDRGRVLEPWLYDGHLRNISLLSVLMDHKKIPVLAADGEAYSLLDGFPYAYHLDNRRFVGYLAEQAGRAGVRHVDCEIVDAHVDADGRNIAALVARDGSRFSFDLYVDCSGFRSLLLEKKLESKFISFDSSLFTDAAVTTTVSHGGVVKPYTTAETMESGWCWHIATLEDDHLGYVYSSAFCSAEQAVAEMRAKHPHMTEPKEVKFRSGRHEHFWKGNVVAIGNSYGFVEPLESTGIQVILAENLWLARLMPVGPQDEAMKEVLNGLVARRWDDLRWFLALHYKFNRRIDSPFWRACRADVDISGAQQALELYRAGAPLTERLSTEFKKIVSFDAFGRDVILMGQHVEGRMIPPLHSRQQYAERVALYDRIAAGALPQAEGYEVLVTRPELLDAHATDPTSWINTYYSDILPGRSG
jgi:tryptophan halogenase